ncbi:MAG: cation:proton antiporter [Bacteroidales bacterium]|jgi:CPA2 family monovalent cation:H+ antiporter-2|nr:cation:proton antiporter [Bacteroidales bacterium]
MHKDLNLVHDLALIFISAGIITLIFRALKQPLVLGYIVAGFIIGPYFKLLPESFSILDESTVMVWSEIGVIFLLFALGLEFSFKKLLKVGGSAVITAVTEVLSMLCIGFVVGHLLGWSNLESVFLGGMLAMSSTTIIIKAFNDLGLRNQKFTTIVFGTLVVEDIVAILMMVMLSTIAVSQSVSGGELIEGLLKLGFFLVLCFLVGIFVLPTFLKKFRTWMNEETLLIISIGLCFSLVVLATHFGFSAALGAFIMGSILAETIEGEHVEHLTKNIKDLFGAVFFVSVGMMVNPASLVEYWFPIVVLTVVTILGKATFSSLGVLLSGQSLRVSLQSGFSLAQIGEFAFIIASLGLSLGIMSNFIYPIIIAVSVITTFTTPYFIRFANPFYEWLNPRIPLRIRTFLDNYALSGEIAKNESEWKRFMKKYFSNILIYSTLSIAIILCFTYIVAPFVSTELQKLQFSALWIDGINSAITIVALLPFLMGIIMISRSNKQLSESLAAVSPANSRRLALLSLLRLFLAMFFITLVVFIHFRHTHSVFPVVFILLTTALFVVFARKNFTVHWRIEDRFLENLNQKEEYERQKSPLRSSISKQMAHSDVHLAELTVSPDSPFVGKSLQELDLRKNYNVNIAKIIRGHKMIYFPGANDYLYPSDQLVAIGTDKHISEFSKVMEMEVIETPQTKEQDIELKSFVVTPQSSVYGKTLAQSNVRAAGCLIIEVDRSGESFINPDLHFVFNEGDLVWIAGTKERIESFV